MGYTYSRDGTEDYTQFDKFKDDFDIGFDITLEGTQFVFNNVEEGVETMKTYETGIQFLMDILKNHGTLFKIEAEFDGDSCEVMIYTSDEPDGVMYKVREK